MPSNTLLLIQVGTVFELDVQRLETLEQLERQYVQALAKHTYIHARLLVAPKRAFFSTNLENCVTIKTL